MNLLYLHSNAQKMILRRGDPLNGKVVTERARRVVVKMDASRHREAIQALLARLTTGEFNARPGMPIIAARLENPDPLNRARLQLTR
jgi:hypothetical protein